MFGSENVHTLNLTIDSDPGGDGEVFFLMKAPRALTVVGSRMVSEQTQNAGTAVTLALQNWGTAGTAVEGTVVAALGGTAAGARLTARTPALGTPVSGHAYVAKDAWLALNYGELGTGWIANDRITYQVDYVMGNAT